MPTPINTSLDQLYTVDELAALSSPATSDLLVLARGGLGKSLSYQSLLDDLFDRLAADWLVQGTGVTLSYNTSTNKMTVSASGGAGATDHAALSNLGWTVSGHTGTASRLAGWDSGGTATTYVIGTGSGQIAAGDHTHSTYTLSAVVPSTAPAAGQVLAGNSGGTAYAPVTVSGSGATISLASTGVMTISGIANTSLANSSVTVTAGTGLSGGGAVALGSSVSLAVSYGTTSGTACQGNDARLSDSRAASSVSTSTTTAISGLIKGATTLAAASAGTDYVAPGGALGTPASGTLANCTGLPPAGLTFSATDKLAGRSTSGGGAGEEIACTAAGRALLDDADAAAQIATLGFAASGITLPSSATNGTWYSGVSQGTYKEIFPDSGAAGDFRVTVPSAGTWIIAANVRTTIDVSSGNIYLTVRLYNVTDAAYATVDGGDYSARLVLIQVGAGSKQQTAGVFWVVATTASKTFALYGKFDGGGTPNGFSISSDSNGYTNLSYARVK